MIASSASNLAVPSRIRLLASCLGSLLGLALSLSLASPVFAESGRAAKLDPGSILSRDDLWPYRVDLIEAWDDGGRLARPLREGTTGVLIRLEDAERARIDFGRSGLYVVPVAKTDLVARMEKTLRGEIEKDAPNFIVAIGPRLLDPSREPLSLVPFGTIQAYDRFLCVYFDATASDSEIETIRARLAPIVRETPGLLTVLFPIGERKDPPMARLLKTVGWDAFFLPDHLADPYAHGLVGEDPELPRLQLTSAEGRVWVEGAIAGETAGETLEKLRELLPPDDDEPDSTTGS